MGHVHTLASVVTQVRAPSSGPRRFWCAVAELDAVFGGFGFTSRLWGLTVDATLAIEVVLANGTITTASETQNSDLFFVRRLPFPRPSNTSL